MSPYSTPVFYSIISAQDLGTEKGERAFTLRWAYLHHPAVFTVQALSTTSVYLLDCANLLELQSRPYIAVKDASSTSVLLHSRHDTFIIIILEICKDIYSFIRYWHVFKLVESKLAEGSKHNYAVQLHRTCSSSLDLNSIQQYQQQCRKTLQQKESEEERRPSFRVGYQLEELDILLASILHAQVGFMYMMY